MQPMILYWIQSELTKNAQTGKIFAREVGPFVVSIIGCAYHEVSNAEVLAYIQKMHGVLPSRVEYKQWQFTKGNNSNGYVNTCH